MNNNKKHPRLAELNFWFHKSSPQHRSKNLCPNMAGYKNEADWLRSVENFIYFYKFETSFQERDTKNRKDEMRAKMKVIT